ncbi:molybdate ABC transporter substrate-binding protein [Planococcus sp. YIM B11945]|uniref:molybdate ABC transporter substrate-binding protein n=1 Tax=Planococcus sp. YIM B11945 TaxID=3435410 RepID=UPI003D7CFFAC
MKKLTLMILLTFFLGACGSSSAEHENKLLVSAASSLTEVMEEAEEAFHKEYPDIELAFNYGSSSKLRSQMQQGAPVDVFLSASEQDMNELTAEQLVAKESVVSFAKNQLVLASNKTFPKNAGFEEQLASTREAIAVGEPDSVPLGRYTKEALEQLGLWKSLEGNLIYAKDARQVLTYVESGNAEVGIMYASDAFVSKKVKGILEFPEELPPVVYPAGIAVKSENTEAAEAFLEFLTGSEGQEILERTGFIRAEGGKP